MEKNYKEALAYLYSQLPMFSRTGGAAYKPGLDTSLALARFFNDPQKKLKCIHVGGTNGKGSTSHMIASILQEQGYKTALYTSPHLVDFRERMRINGRMIPEEKVVEFVNKWENSSYTGHPSFFELTMIMAFNWFAEEKVDYAVIEVGMGGRLDSTNIIMPLVSVITNITHDHNQFLGNTLQEIAGEKAGIIKERVPVVIGETQAETEQIFKKKASENNTVIVFADQALESTTIESTEEGMNISYNGLEIHSPLGGDYQKKNLKTVLTVTEVLNRSGIQIDQTSIKSGIEKVIENTGLTGRWLVINKTPLTIADTGHNIAGLEYNFRQLERLLAKKGKGILRVIIGFVADKAIDKILDLLPKNAEYYVTNAQIPRALPAEKLLEKFIEKGLKGKAYSTVGDAYQEAKKEASEKDLIFIGGSTFIVADFLESENSTS
ncbi:MAG: bifunctional folylpolyglutamate synthase/dihydrofolate synthase [Muribaculaceae bacterium]|nr:bifunctional folylpolyglutamate synthase/dihydrofolate synthase [Muribaculaceae bacterium]